MGPMSLCRMVSPFGAERATDWVPIVPAAPGLLSTTTERPERALMWAPKARAIRSALPPGV